MATRNYDSLLNDKVLFLQGPQSELNKYFENSNDAKEGAAQEGAFYLTTDTHRLYVGRRLNGTSTIYPVQVSEGITTLATDTELSTAAATAQEGDFYYVANRNMLLVRSNAINPETGLPVTWVQLNPPTGIDNVTVTATREQDATTHQDTDNVIVNVSVQTSGGSQQDSIKLVAGANVTLTPSNDNTSITVASQNSQSTLSVDTNANRGEVVLSDGTNADTEVFFAGAGDVSVTSGVTNNENIVTITGPTVQGVTADNRGDSASPTGNTHGFEFITKVTPGGSGSTVDRSLANSGSVFDPVIDYGTNSSAYFYGGHAALDVYTRSEADSAISSAITSSLHAANAMTYKGTVDSADKLTSTSATGSVRANAHIGDTYKVVVPSATLTTDPASGYKALQLIQPQGGVGASESIYLKTGDLVIANGTEDANGVLVPGTMYWDVVPAGDEPKLVGAATQGLDSYFALEDANNNNSTTLKVTFDSTDTDGVTPAYITAVGQDTSPTDHHIKLFHKSITRTDVLNTTLGTPQSTDADSVGVNGLKFFALTNALTDTDTKTGGITTDVKGHITGVIGKVLTLKHNYITALTATHTAASGTIDGTAGYIGTITMSGSNSISGLSTSSASVQIGSHTLNIAADNANTQLTMDIVWGAF